jgi:hypothetical protein
MTKVDTEKYVEFVKGVTSEPSLDYGAMGSRLAELEVTGTNTSQLLTAALGLTAESGEFTEALPICWYLAQACMALDTTFDEVIEMNVEKLESRYPGGSFDVHHSENRAEGDL